MQFGILNKSALAKEHAKETKHKSNPFTLILKTMKFIKRMEYAHLCGWQNNHYQHVLFRFYRLFTCFNSNTFQSPLMNTIVEQLAP